MLKTFAYQLGEVRGLEWAREVHLNGTRDLVDPAECAANSAEVDYFPGNADHAEYVAGFSAAWERWYAAPEFLHGAPIDPPVIVTEGALVAALMAAFPNAKEIDFHGQVARFLIKHVTTAGDN